MPGDLVPASDTAHPCVVEESPHFVGIDTCFGEPVEPLFPFLFAVLPMTAVSGEVGDTLVSPFEPWFAHVV